MDFQHCVNFLACICLAIDFMQVVIHFDNQVAAKKVPNPLIKQTLISCYSEKIHSGCAIGMSFNLIEIKQDTSSDGR